MSFQSYLKNIQAKTGMSPADYRARAEEKGFTEGRTLRDRVKTTDVVNWLKDEHALGHGHAMAIYALLKGAKTETSD